MRFFDKLYAGFVFVFGVAVMSWVFLTGFVMYVVGQEKLDRQAALSNFVERDGVVYFRKRRQKTK